MNQLVGDLRRLIERLPASSEIAGRMKRAEVSAGDLNSLADLGRIPVLKKEQLPALQRQANGLGSLLPFGGMAAAGRIYYSPFGVLDFEPRTGGHWRAERAVEAAGVGAGDVLINTFSYHMTPAARMLDDSAIAAGATVVPSGPGQIPMQLDIMRRVGVTTFVGLPSFLGMLIDAALEQGLDWKKEFRLSRAIVGGEPITAAARRRFEQDFGIEVFSVYGTADIGIIGYECSEHNGWHVDDDVIVQTCDPESGLPGGNVGEVVVTLVREFYPLVRFAIGDLSRLEAAPCACGRSGVRLMGLLGRANQTVKVRGMFIYPGFAAEIAAAHDWIETVRILIEHHSGQDRMRILVLPKSGLAAPANLKAVEDTVRAVTRLRGDVELVNQTTFRLCDKTVEDIRTWN
jgi:phenylacetate-CoA ligase